jgi:transcriptional regulator with XRE-family HTH domain
MNRIKEFREAAGLTQQELAEASGVARNSISLYEASTYTGKIRADVQERIATALQQPVSVVFGAAPTDMSRRQMLTNLATLGAGAAGLGMVGGIPLSDMLFRRITHLSDADMRQLIDANHATWQLLEGVQRGVSLDYINSIAHGKLVALTQLAQHSLPAAQRKTLLLLIGDMHILLGRLQRDIMNYGTAEAHFNRAIEIAKEIDSADLETAARHRLGNMILLDALKPTAAVRNADILLEVSKKASFPLWAEAQLMAGAAYAYAGRYSETQRLTAEARARKGPDPEIWIGAIGNPPAIYADMALITSLAVGRYVEAYQHSVEAIDLINADYPDNTHWRLNVESMQAQALWGLRDTKDAAETAIKCLISSRVIGNAASEARLERLYTLMAQSKESKHPAVKTFGEHLFAQ